MKPGCGCAVVRPLVQEPFEFEPDYARATDVLVGGATVKLAAIDDLIALKQAAGRDKDRMDIEALTGLKSDGDEDGG